MTRQRQTRPNHRADRDKDDRNEGAWFVPKRYGYGATPVRWQGWALVAAYVAAMLGIGISGLPIAALVVLIVAATAAFTLITIHKTHGGLRWRWGGRDPK